MVHIEHVMDLSSMFGSQIYSGLTALKKKKKRPFLKAKKKTSDAKFFSSDLLLEMKMPLSGQGEQSKVLTKQ